MTREPLVGVVTFPLVPAGKTPLSALMKIIMCHADKAVVITGGAGYDTLKDDGRVELRRVEHRSDSSLVGRIKEYFLTQIRISVEVLKGGPNVWFFFIGGEVLLLPALVVKLTRKRLVLILAGSNVQVSNIKADGTTTALELLTSTTSTIADSIVIYSSCLINDYGLGRFSKKIKIAHRHYVDTASFRQLPIKLRDQVVCYVGRLSPEKGVMNLIRAIPSTDAHLVIIGDGEQKEELEREVVMLDISNRVDFFGWVDHEELPDHLSKMRLLVLPSFTEGLPNIIIEAMACGTPVLTTSVGAVRDLVSDGQTGYLLPDNSPESIASGINEALADPSVEKVVKAAYNQIINKYSLEAVAEIWSSIVSGSSV